MPSLNRAQIIGHVGKEPEMRFTPNGNPIANFSVAVNSKVKDNESTEWFNIVAWNKLAETCNQYLKKGALCYIEGRLQTRSWEADSGKKYKTELIANKVVFMSKKDTEGDVDD